MAVGSVPPPREEPGASAGYPLRHFAFSSGAALPHAFMEWPSAMDRWCSENPADAPGSPRGCMSVVGRCLATSNSSRVAGRLRTLACPVALRDGFVRGGFAVGRSLPETKWLRFGRFCGRGPFLRRSDHRRPGKTLRRSAGFAPVPAKPPFGKPFRIPKSPSGRKTSPFEADPWVTPPGRVPLSRISLRSNSRCAACSGSLEAHCACGFAFCRRCAGCECSRYEPRAPACRRWPWPCSRGR